MTDYVQEQEMEIEALQAILMDDIQEIDKTECGLDTDSPCFQIIISPKDDDEDERTEIPVRIALLFAHTRCYPDEPPLFAVRSLQGVRAHDLQELKAKLVKEASENLGMAMVFTLVTLAKEWLRDKYGKELAHGDSDNGSDADEKDEIIEPHGELVTVESFVSWRERFEAEQALERAKLIPDSAFVALKEKRMTGRAWFESGAMKGSKPIINGSEETEEDIDFDEDFDDGDIDEDDMLQHYLSEKTE